MHCPKLSMLMTFGSKVRKSCTKPQPWNEVEVSSVNEPRDTLIVEDFDRSAIVQSLIIGLYRVNVVACISDRACCLLQDDIKVNGISKEPKKCVHAVLVERFSSGVDILAVICARAYGRRWG